MVSPTKSPRSFLKEQDLNLIRQSQQILFASFYKILTLRNIRIIKLASLRPPMDRTEK